MFGGFGAFSGWVWGCSTYLGWVWGICGQVWGCLGFFWGSFWGVLGPPSRPSANGGPRRRFGGFGDPPVMGGVRDGPKVLYLPHDHRQGQRLNAGVLAWLRWGVCQVLPAGVPAGNWYAFLRKLVQVPMDCAVLAAQAGRTALKGKGTTCPAHLSCTPVLYLFLKATGPITTAVDLPRLLASCPSLLKRTIKGLSKLTKIRSTH